MDFLQRGTDAIKLATAADNAKNYDEALTQYITACDFFVAHLRYEKNERLAKQLRERVEIYVARAEKLKQLTGRTTAAPTAATGQGEAATKSSGNSNATQDMDTLGAQVENAIVQMKPDVKWSDIAGLDHAKATLQEAVVLPLKLKHLFVGKRQSWKGILLYGPPGTGKSYLAKAVANEVDATFFSISSADLVSKWMGESERLVKQLFAKARQHRPAVIFVDEIDSLCGARGENDSESAKRIKTQFLVEMNGVGNDTTDILVLAATNLPWQLDSAIRRRFEKRIYIALPDDAARATMFLLHGGSQVDLSDEEVVSLAEQSNGYSGSDIAIVLRDATMMPVRRLLTAQHFRRDGSYWLPCEGDDDGAQQCEWQTLPAKELGIRNANYQDVLASLQSNRPSVAPEDLNRYTQFTQQFGQDA